MGDDIGWKQPSIYDRGRVLRRWRFLRELGYNHGEFGKNHLGDHTDALPTAHGFHELWDTCIT